MDDRGGGAGGAVRINATFIIATNDASILAHGGSGLNGGGGGGGGRVAVYSQEEHSALLVNMQGGGSGDKSTCQGRVRVRVGGGRACDDDVALLHVSLANVWRAW